MKPFTFVDFEREAQAILAEARERAGAVLQQALVEAGNIREKARSEGIEAGRREAEPEQRRLAALLEQAAARINERRAELCAEAERDLVRLAVAIAERVVKAEVVLGRPVAEGNLKRAIELAARRRILRVRAHPADMNRLPEIAGICRVPDPSLQEGGLVVETADGSIDVDLRTQLDQIERGLLE